MTKRIYVGDLHLTAQSSHEGPRAWGRTDHHDVGQLASFLASDLVRAQDELVLVGDTFDQWLCPIDVRPPTVHEIVEAPYNRPVMAALRALAGRNVQVVYIPGNRDMHVTAADVEQAIPGCRFAADGIDEPGLRVEHGHRRCMFNGPDPKARPYPLGYYLTRLSATSGARSGKRPPTLQTILHDLGGAATVIAKPGRLGEAIVDALMTTLDQARAPVRRDEDVLMPAADDAPVKVGAIGPTYGNLYYDWKERWGDPFGAVERELEPWYGLPWPPEQVVIHGHTHDHVGGNRSYLNLGEWCARPRYFATTEQTDHHLKYELHHWRETSYTTVKSDTL